MNRKTKESISIKTIVLLVVFLTTLSSAYEALRNAVYIMKSQWSAANSDNTQEYSNMKITGAVVQKVDQIEGEKPRDGYAFYKFTVTMENAGTVQENKKYSTIYVNSGDGYASTHNPESNYDLEDTRIIPAGRTGTLITYGEVIEGATNVQLSTYSTPDSEPFTYTCPLESDTTL